MTKSLDRRILLHRSGIEPSTMESEPATLPRCSTKTTTHRYFNSLLRSVYHHHHSHCKLCTAFWKFGEAFTIDQNYSIRSRRAFPRSQELYLSGRLGEYFFKRILDVVEMFFEMIVSFEITIDRERLWRFFKNIHQIFWTICSMLYRHFWWLV